MHPDENNNPSFTPLFTVITVAVKFTVPNGNVPRKLIHIPKRNILSNLSMREY